MPSPSFRLTQARVVFLRQGRNIASDKRRLITAWMKSRSFPNHHVSLFPSEILVTKDGTKYWLPIQRILAAVLRNDLSLANTPIAAYVNFVGYYNKIHVFIVYLFAELRLGRDGIDPFSGVL